MYTTSHEDRKIETERDACDAAVCWGSEQPVGIDLVLLAAERMLADADRCLASFKLKSMASRLSRETETLRNLLAEERADLARIDRERERHERRRCQDHAAALPEHLLDLGVAMQQGLREERR